VKTRSVQPEPEFRRKIRYTNPRLQGRAALIFSGIIVACGVLFGSLVYRDVGKALWAAAARGHYMFGTPYEIARNALLWHLAGLSATVACLGAGFFFLLLRAIHRGIGRVTEVLRASDDGDLSTPTDARGLKEFGRIGELVDAARDDTLQRIVAIREEAALLAASGLPPEAFRPRWDELKRKIREIAP